MSMLCIEKVLTFCDRRRLSCGNDSRRSLIEMISSSREPESPSEDKSTAETAVSHLYNNEERVELCLSIKIEMDPLTGSTQMFELLSGDDVLDQIHAFSKRHTLNVQAQSYLIYHVLYKLARSDQIIKGSRHPVFKVSLYDRIEEKPYM